MHALEGVVLVDFGQYLAGPFGPMIIGDLGADVIKVEPITGDGMRPVNQPFTGCQRGKRDIALDVKSERGLEIAMKLIERADIVHHNMTVGTADRLGIGYDAAKAVNPDVVYCNTFAYGAEGPLAKFGGLDPLFQASAGLEYESGPVEGGNPPMYYRFGMTDTANAMLSVLGCLTALYHQRKTGEGQELWTSLLDGGQMFASDVFVRDGVTSTYPKLDGDQTGLGPTYRLYETGDGWLQIAAVTDAHWRAALRRPRHARARRRPTLRRCRGAPRQPVRARGDHRRAAPGPHRGHVVAHARGRPHAGADRHPRRRARALRRRERAARPGRRVRAPDPRHHAPVRQPHRLLRDARRDPRRAAARGPAHEGDPRLARLRRRRHRLRSARPTPSTGPTTPTPGRCETHAMPVCVALLRAVNVGGKRKVPMAALRSLCEDLGYDDVATYVNSGNVVFRASGTTATVEAALERAIAKEFGFHVDVSVRTAAQWSKLVVANPFAKESKATPNFVQLFVSKGKVPTKAAAAKLQERAKAGEQVKVAGGALWIHYPKGIGTSKLTATVIDAAVGHASTGQEPPHRPRAREDAERRSCGGGSRPQGGAPVIALHAATSVSSAARPTWVTVSTSLASARSAATVHCSLGRVANGSNW